MARIETSARKPTLSLDITSSWRRKRNRALQQLALWNPGRTPRKKKDPSCVLKGDLGRLPGGGEVWLTPWNVGAGGRGRRRQSYSCSRAVGPRKPVLGLERPENPVL